MRKIITGALILLFIAANGYAETVVFEGSPQMANYSSPEETFNMSLNTNDQVNYRCVVTKEGGKYYWSSREKKPMNHIKSGEFDYFVNPDGSGYIKIAKLKDGRYAYMETMNVTFRIMTYWGIVDKFEP